MVKFVAFLCLALVSGHSASAVWPYNGQGDENAQASPLYADTFGYSSVSLPGFTGAQYVDPQVLAQQPQVSSELLDAQVTPIERKPYGTKTISGFIRGKKKQQQQILQVQPLPSYSDINPDQFGNGYLEPVPAVPATVNVTTETKGKSKLRYILPWNWFVLGTSNKDQSLSNAPGQPAAPKRSWSIFPQRTVPVVAARPQQFCQCYPYYPQQLYPVYNTPEDSQPNTGSNVQQVPASTDHQGMETKPTVTIVAPPQSSSNVVGSHNLPMQQHVTNEQMPSLPSTGAADQLTTQQQPQGVASQQVQYSQYQNPANTYTGNTNPQTIPVGTNYQSPTGEAVQSG